MTEQIPYRLFNRKQNDLPVSVMSIVRRPQNWSEMQYCVLAKLPYKPKENGFPEGIEFDRVANLEEEVIKILEPKSAIHLGHITHNGSMLVAFQSSSGIPAEVKVRSGLLTQIRIPLQIQLDPEWTFFEKELTPSEGESQESDNRRLILKLAEDGDKAELSRLVDFAANFPTEKGRAAFLSSIKVLGYQPTENATWEAEEGPNPFWCEVEAHTDIRPETMASRCACLSELANTFGGEFDGWASPVTKP